MARLVVERGPSQGATFDMPDRDGAYRVGRSSQCDLIVADRLVSRQHFEIFRKGDTFKLRNLESHNGTYINGNEVRDEVPLRFGDTIKIGATVFVFLRGRSESGDDPLTGSALGDYEILDRIGSGGMGNVYRAIQKSLDRMVAVKVLHRDLTQQSSFVDSFMREAKHAGKLNHPHVVHVHEVGCDRGHYFFSMEYLPGGSVQDLTAGNQKLPVERALNITLQAARALEYAESENLVHCDIKPDNLMLTEEGEVRLTDLGIARPSEGQIRDTDAEVVFGSPHFMSPEQARGMTLDHRSDLYSLGATFYRMLTGRTVFSGASAKEIMEKQVYQEPDPIRTIEASVPPSVARIVHRLLEKKPENRYLHAEDLIRDLESARDELTDRGRVGTLMGPPGIILSGRHTRVRKPIRVRSSLWLAPTILGLGAIATAVFFSIKARETIDQTPGLLRDAARFEQERRYEDALKLYRRVLEIAADPQVRERVGRDVTRLETGLYGRGVRFPDEPEPSVKPPEPPEYSEPEDEPLRKLDRNATGP